MSYSGEELNWLEGRPASPPPRPKRCPTCDGITAIQLDTGDIVCCPTCDPGLAAEYYRTLLRTEQHRERACENCDGTGVHVMRMIVRGELVNDHAVCPVCGGSGQIA